MPQMLTLEEQALAPMDSWARHEAGMTRVGGERLAHPRAQP